MNLRTTLVKNERDRKAVRSWW